jgi:hypothetical protein
MGTTLTGTTPQDTYESLIKVTDNGPLTGSLKKLTDGLGNDSSLSLSTTAASLSGTLAVTSGLTAATGSFLGSSANGTLSAEIAVEGVASNNVALIAKTSNGGNDIFRWFDGATQLGVFKNSGNVGIGTSTPSSKLHVFGSDAGASPSPLFRVGNSGANYTARMVLTDETTNDGNIVYQGGATGTDQYIGLGLGTSFDDVKITGNGYVRLKSGMGGIQFNGDTAAANALDDYEEGTWTIGVSFGGAAAGVTYGANTGTYTKIGRQVTVNGYMELTSKGSSTGDAAITGLPFTIASGVSFNNSASLRLVTISFADFYTGAGGPNTTIVSLLEVTTAGVTTALTNANFANNSELVISLTYFV